MKNKTQATKQPKEYSEPSATCRKHDIQREDETIHPKYCLCIMNCVSGNVLLEQFRNTSRPAVIKTCYSRLYHNIKGQSFHEPHSIAPHNEPR